MKLLTKVLVTFIALLVLAPIAGFVAIENGYQNEIKRITNSLDVMATRIASSDSALSTALVSADESEIAITVAFVDESGSFSTIVDGDVNIEVSPSQEDLQQASTKTLTLPGEPTYLLRTVSLGGDDFVVLETSIENAQHSRSSDLQTLLIASILSTSIGGTAVTILIRRDLRAAIATLRGTADQERETRQSMQNFMGDASHELRTPLTVIKGYAELLAQSGAQTSDEQRAKAYARITEQVNRMDDTISSLLQLAEVGSVSSNSFTTVDLTALVRGAAEDLLALSAKRPVELDLTQVSVKGSAELLTRLLANAIGNISRHTGKTDPVHCSLTKDRKSALLIIEDGGPGLPAEAYESGIQGFRRFDESRSRETGGTGLGMTIMKSIVEAHSGELALAPSSLGGLKLEIRLPLN